MEKYPSSTMLTKRGQAFVKTEISGSIFPIVLTKEPLLTVAAVPATPIRRFLVARTAEIEAGATTPTKGTGRMSPISEATELTVPQAAIMSFTPFERRNSASSFA